MNTFQSNIISIYGEKGKEWLSELPAIVSVISSRLDLRDLKAVTNLSYNYVLSGFQGDNPIILKLGLDHEALTREAFALKCFKGGGSVKVLAEDEGMLLLERAVPGTSLKSYFPTNENESIEIACRVMKNLHQADIPTTHNFPHIKDWLAVLDRHCEELSSKQSRNDHIDPQLFARDEVLLNYLQKAINLRDQLIQTHGVDVLLHGDLHHDNILQNGETWVVIDPKGVIGSPMNEIWAFIMDIERDIPFIAHYFNFRTQDVFNWYFVHLMLAVCWNLEDDIDASLFLSLAAKSFKYVS